MANIISEANKKRLAEVVLRYQQPDVVAELQDIIEDMAVEIAAASDVTADADIAAAVAAINPHSTWRALLTQSSTSAPVATVRGTNDIGTVTLARTSAGVYTLTKTGAWTSTKTLVFHGGFDSGANLVDIKFALTSANVITLTTNVITFDGDGVMTKTPTDGLLTAFPVTIEVYP